MFLLSYLPNNVNLLQALSQSLLHDVRHQLPPWRRLSLRNILAMRRSILAMRRSVSWLCGSVSWLRTILATRKVVVSGPNYLSICIYVYIFTDIDFTHMSYHFYHSGPEWSLVVGYIYIVIYVYIYI